MGEVWYRVAEYYRDSRKDEQGRMVPLPYQDLLLFTPLNSEAELGWRYLAELRRMYAARVEKRFPMQPQLKDRPAGARDDETVFLI